MKKVKHRILSAVLSVVCAATFAAAYAPLTASAEDTAFPEKFDLRDVDGINFVSPVRSQDPWGTCWAFSACAAAEISIQYEIWKKYGIKPEENPIDLSERALTWFSNTPLPEDSQLSPAQNTEGVYTVDTEYINAPLDAGGTDMYALSRFAAGIGPYYEADAPYRNEEGLIAWAKIDENGDYVWDENGEPVFELHGIDWDAPEDFRLEGYTGRVTWAASESLRETSVPVLEHAYLMDPPLMQNEKGELVLNETFMNRIKEELMNGRGVDVAFRADTYLSDQPDGEPVYISDKFAHYTYDSVSTNHQVCIVGWDDTYSRENFLSGESETGESRTPPGDGAWIAKNSWGAADRDFPDNGDWGVDGSGYFYLSYYDKSVRSPRSFDFDVTSFLPDAKQQAYIVDQYDMMAPGFFWYDVLEGVTESDFSYANVFTVRQNQLLKYVSSIPTFDGSTVKYEIYKLNAASKTPDDGELLASFERTYPYGGYQREELETPIALSAGEKYSIVLTVEQGGTYYLTVAADFNKEYVEHLNDLYDQAGMEYAKDRAYAKGIINSGESWIGTAEGWIDEAEYVSNITEADYINPLTGETEKCENALAFDNFPIKGYSIKGDDIKFRLNVISDQKMYAANDVISFAVKVVNPSDTYSLYDLELTNDFSGKKETINAIPPQSEFAFVYNYTVTDKDVEAGRIDLKFNLSSAYTDKTAETTVSLKKEPLNVSDAVRLARFVAEDKSIKGISVKNSDYDNDGILTASDVTYLLAKIAKLDKPVTIDMNS